MNAFKDFDDTNDKLPGEPDKDDNDLNIAKSRKNSEKATNNQEQVKYFSPTKSMRIENRPAIFHSGSDEEPDAEDFFDNETHGNNNEESKYDDNNDDEDEEEEEEEEEEDEDEDAYGDDDFSDENEQMEDDDEQSQAESNGEKEASAGDANEQKSMEIQAQKSPSANAKNFDLLAENSQLQVAGDSETYHMLHTQKGGGQLVDKLAKEKNDMLKGIELTITTNKKGLKEKNEDLEQEEQDLPKDKRNKASCFSPSKKKISKEKSVVLDRKKTMHQLKKEKEKEGQLLAEAAAKLNKAREGKVKQAIRKRKSVRIFFFLIFLLAILIASILCSYYRYLTGSFGFPNSSGFNLNIVNCTLYMSDFSSTDPNQVFQFNYRIQSALSLSSSSSVTNDNASPISNINFVNGYDPDYCQINLYIQPNAVMSSLNITCQQCHIIDKVTKLTVINSITISGQIVHANLGNVTTGNFNYQTINGYLQLNNIATTSTSTSNVASIQLKGDIIIQSLNGLIINAASPSNSYCFSANYSNAFTQTSCSSATNKTINPSCTVNVTLCLQSTCTDNLQSKWFLNTNTGSIYANIIPSAGISASNNTNNSAGYIFGQGIQFDPNVTNSLNEFANEMNDTSKTAPILIINLGDVSSQSSLFTKWTITANPAYAYMKPWWISTFSATLLNNNALKIQGGLLPGFCPWKQTFSLSDQYIIQENLITVVNSSTPIYSMIWDKLQPSPVNQYLPSNGFFTFSTLRIPIEDFWYTIYTTSTGGYSLIDNNIDQSVFVVASVAISLVIAAFISFLLLEITIIAINIMYYKVVDEANHLHSYTQLEKGKTTNNDLKLNIEEQKDNQNDQKKKKKESKGLKKYTFLNILRNSPSLSAFVDFLTLILYRQFGNSVKQFYRLLFTLSKTDQKDVQDPSKDLIKGTEAKTLYEKFCFLNHLVEKKLTDKDNIKLLRQYDFEIVTKEDSLAEVYIRMTLKRHQEFRKIDAVEGKTSLQLFIENYVEFTQFDSDQVETTYFSQIYSDFCDFNRLTPEMVSTTVMKDLYKVEVNQVPQQFITRISNTEDDQDLHVVSGSVGFVDRIKAKLNQIFNKPKRYALDKSKMENHFNLLTERFEKIPDDEQLAEATVDLILYPQWWAWDALTVIFHMLVSAFITFPLLFLVYLMESQYQPYSLKDPSTLIAAKDIFQDPANFVVKLWLIYPWDIAIIVIICCFWIISFFDILLYYSIMDFPQDKSFKTSNKQNSLLYKISRTFQWFLVLFSLACYYGYIGLVLIWLLLGAIINPNAFLPYASGASTFVTFCTAKYQQFKKLSEDGKKIIMSYIDNLFGGIMSKIMKKITDKLQEAAQFVSNGAKSLVKSEVFNEVAGKMAETGLLDAETLEDLKSKVSSLDPKAIGAAVLKDPSQMLKEMDAIAEQIKQKAIQKVLSECEKREIPGVVVNTVLGLVMKEKEKLRESVVEILNKGPIVFPEGISDLLIDAVFPKTISREEFAIYLSQRLCKVIMVHFKVNNNVRDFTPEMFIKVIECLEHLRNEDYTQLLDFVKYLIKNCRKLQDFQEIQQFVPLIEIIAAISSRNPKIWEIKTSTFNLMLNLANNKNNDQQSYYSYSDNESETDANQNMAMMKNIIEFLSLILSKNEIVYDMEDSSKTIDYNRQWQIVSKFVESVGSKIFPKGCSAESLIYLTLAYIKQEVNDIPKEVIKQLEKGLKLNLGANNGFLQFCFTFSNVAFLLPQSFCNKMDKCAKNFSFKGAQKEFLRLSLTYKYEELITAKNDLNENKIFKKIAEMLKLSTQEVMGFLDLIFDRTTSPNIEVFIKGIMKRMKINEDHYKNIKYTYDILVSYNENVLLNALNYFNLDFSEFLLVGKGLFNPKYIDIIMFYNLKIEDENLIQQRKTVFSETSSFEKWKGELRNKLQDVYNKLSKPDLSASLAGAAQGTSTPGNDIKLTPTDENKIWKELIEANSENKQNHDDQNKFINESESDSSVKKVQAKTEFLRRINLVKLYLSNWSAIALNEKSLDSILKCLDTPQNRLIKMMNQETSGSSNKPFKVLVSILEIKSLQIWDKITKLGKERVSVINHLANLINVNEEALRNLVQLFTVSDSQPVITSLRYFLKFDADQIPLYKNVVDFILKQNDLMATQMTFLNSKLPSYIKTNDPNFRISEGFAKKVYLESNYHMSILNQYDLFNLMLSKFIEIETEREKVLTKLMKFGNLLRGTIPKRQIASICKIESKLITNIITNFSLMDPASRLSALINSFQGNHPFKIFLVWYAFFFEYNITVVTVKSGAEKSKTTESIKQYLGKVYRIAPEIFDLIENIAVSDISKFIDGVINLIRRLNNTSLVDFGMIKSALSLMTAERFNTTYLASRLGIASEKIDFVICILRIKKKVASESIPRSQKEAELNFTDTSIPFRKISEILRINKDEALSLIRLIFNIFEDDNTISDILDKLKLKDDINLHLFKGIVCINQEIEPSTNIGANNKTLQEFEKTQKNFYDELKVDTTYGILISRLLVGDFLSIEYFSSSLQWIFPNNAQGSIFMKHLTMGLCGYANSRVKFGTGKFQADMANFSKEFYPKKVDGKLVFKPTLVGKKKKTQQACNSLGYAIYLLYETVNISPIWAKAFILDAEFYKNDLEKSHKLSKEFILSIVLNWVAMVDCMRDVIGALEFLENSYIKVNGNLRYTGCIPAVIKENYKKISKNLKSNVIKAFSTKFTFDIHTLQTMAKAYMAPGAANILLDINEDEFQREINKSLCNMILLIEFHKLPNPSDANDKGNNLFAIAKGKFNQTPDTFIREVVQEAKKLKDEEDPFKEEEEQDSEDYFDKVTEYLFNNIIRRAYSSLDRDFGYQDRYSGWELTNLCILSGLHILRYGRQRDEDYYRMLYNINKVFMNIERKLLFDDLFIYFSKFRKLKLVGLAAGYRISNIVEWCLPKSLLKQEYVRTMAKKLYHNSDTKTKEIKIWYLANEILNKFYESNWCIGRELLLEGINGDKKIDSGLLSQTDWEGFSMEADINSRYVGNSDSGNGFGISDFNNELGPLFKKCKIKKDDLLHYKDKVNPSLVYCSRDVVSIKYDENGNIIEILDEADEPRKDYNKKGTPGNNNDKQNPYEITQSDLKVDPRTSQARKIVSNSMLEFEINLFHPNVLMIEGIVKGNMEVLFDPSNNIGSKGPSMAKIYHSLITLQSIKRKHIFSRKNLKDSLGNITSRLISDIARVEELLAFLIDNATPLTAIIGKLEIEKLQDLLFISNRTTINAGEDDENVESKKSSLNSTLEELSKMLINIVKMTPIEVQTINLIVKVYKLKPAGWEDLISKLIIPDQDGKIDFAKKHPLKKITKMLNINMIRKLRVIGTNEYENDEGLLEFFKINNSNAKNAICGKLDQIMRSFCITDSISSTYSKLELWNRRENSWLPVVTFFHSMITGTKENIFDILFDGKVPPYKKNKEPIPSIAAGGGTGIIGKMQGLDGNILDIASPLSKKKIKDQTTYSSDLVKMMEDYLANNRNDSIIENPPNEVATLSDGEQLMIHILDMFNIIDDSKIDFNAFLQSFKIFKIFICLSTEKFSAYKAEKKKPDLSDKLADEMIQYNIINISELSVDKPAKLQIVNFMIGIYTWDEEIFLRNLYSEKTKKEFATLFSIWCIIYVDKLLSNYYETYNIIDKCCKILHRLTINTLAPSRHISDEELDKVINESFPDQDSINQDLDIVFSVLHDGKSETSSWLLRIEDAWDNNLHEYDDSDQYGECILLQSIATGEFLSVFNSVVKDAMRKLGVDESMLDFPNQIIKFTIDMGMRLLDTGLKEILAKAQEKNEELNKKKQAKEALQSEAPVNKPGDGEVQKLEDKPVTKAAPEINLQQPRDDEEDGKLVNQLNSVQNVFETLGQVNQLAKFKEAFQLIPLIIELYITLQEDFTEDKILNEIIMIANTLINDMREVESAKFIKTIFGCVLGIDFDKLQECKLENVDKASFENMEIKVTYLLNNRIELILNNVLQEAFPELKNYPQLSLENFNRILELTKVIKKDFINNIKNPPRLEEQLYVFVDILGNIIPRLNKELIQSLIGLSFGKFGKVKTLMQVYALGKDHFKAMDALIDKKKELQEMEKKVMKIEVKDVGKEVKEDANHADNQKNWRKNLQADIDKYKSIVTENETKIIEKVEKMFTYIQDASKMLDFSGLKSKLNLGDAQGDTQLSNQPKGDPEQWALIMKKISEGKAKPIDLFQVVDRAGDNSGTINEEEFGKLASRLGIKLTSHRINEIFAKVKGSKAGSGNLELNEKEFEKAMSYLQGKNLLTAMQLLGITPEILTAILIRLIILLLLIFVFIFLGIKAFALGGTFGAIINSMFPAAGGVGLGKESESDKAKLKEDSVAQACDKGIEIVQSEQL